LQLDGSPSPFRLRVRRADEFQSVVQRPDGSWVSRFEYVGVSMW
jgi:hypothetical protein